jgi:hypothetical protein
LIKDFEFKKPLEWINKEFSELIKSSNSISVHIRRWDYVATAKSNDFHWSCSVWYYMNSIEYFKDKITDPTYFFFSDDIEWVKSNIWILTNAYYIDNNSWNSSWEDMRLMSLCKHNIIANSSFSWWWAWLNRNPKKIVLGPKKWFNNNNLNTEDILPDNWIKL